MKHPLRLCILPATVIIILGLIFRPNPRKGKNVWCTYDIAMNNKTTLTGIVVYSEDDYIVVSGTMRTRMGFTGGEEIYRDCEGCTPGVSIMELSGSIPVYDTQTSDAYIMEKKLCIRDELRYKDMVMREKYRDSLYEIEEK